MSKSVTAVAVLILVEKHRLRLDDPVEQHLPEFRGISVLEARAGEQPALRRPVRPPTVRDFLTHTSGVPHEIPAEVQARFSRPKSLAELVPIIANAPLLFDPGTDYRYSDMGYVVLGRLVEVASGQPFEEFVRRRIFSPLGMKDSFFVPPPDRRDRIASAYEIKDGRLEKASYYDISQMAWLTFPWPSFSMFSTACDLFAFYQMVLNGGSFGGKRILSRKTVKLMTSVQAERTKTRLSGTAYGFGWFVSREPQRALWPQTPGSYGHCGLLNTCAWVDPEWELIRVFLMQRVPEGPEVVLVNEERDIFMQTAQAAIIMAPN
jgi:CubicO group peptidase (beta-lactamase class C family)